jgi:hypothetical protein
LTHLVQDILLLACFRGKINKKGASELKNTNGVVAAVSMVYDIHRRLLHGADESGRDEDTKRVIA